MNGALSCSAWLGIPLGVLLLAAPGCSDEDGGRAAHPNDAASDAAAGPLDASGAGGTPGDGEVVEGQGGGAGRRGDGGASDASHDANAADGSTAGPGWAVPTGGPYATLLSRGPDGTLYAGSWDGRVYAVSPSGETKWTYPTGARIDSAPVVADGKVVVGSWSGSVSALELDGSLAWSVDTDGPIDVSVAVGPDGAVYAASEDGTLYAVELADGAPRWFAPLGAAPTTAPAVHVAGGTTRIVIGTSDGRLHAYDSSGAEGTGPVALPADSGHAVAAFAFGADGTAYSGTSRGHLVGFDASGAIALDAALTYWEAVVFPPVIDTDGTLYLGATDRNLYAVRPDGSVVWNVAVGGSILSSPTLGDDGALYVAARHLVRCDKGGDFERLDTVPLGSSPVVVDGEWFADSLDGAIVSGELPAAVGLAAAPSVTQQGGYDRRGVFER